MNKLWQERTLAMEAHNKVLTSSRLLRLFAPQFLDPGDKSVSWTKLGSKTLRFSFSGLPLGLLSLLRAEPAPFRGFTFRS